MKPILFPIIIVVSFLTSTLSAKAFHLLIMSDTQDQKLTNCVQTSMHNIEESFSYLASLCNIPLKIKKLSMHDGTLTRKNIVRWIIREDVKHDDVIILYYHGHGCRESTDDRIWPRGCLLFDPTDIYKKEVDFSLLAEKLFSKRAALCLIFLDCCNDLPQQLISKNALQISCNAFDLEEYKKYEGITKQCQELFFHRYGFVIASATSPGEIGYGWPPGYGIPPEEVGGVFMNTFLNTLFQDLQTAKPNWKMILKKTSQYCYDETSKKEKRYRMPQTPQHRVFLYKRRKSKRLYKKIFLKIAR